MALKHTDEETEVTTPEREQIDSLFSGVNLDISEYFEDAARFSNLNWNVVNDRTEQTIKKLQNGALKTSTQRQLALWRFIQENICPLRPANEAWTLEFPAVYRVSFAPANRVTTVHKTKANEQLLKLFR